MEKFRGVDYYGVEGLLSEEERMVRDAVRDWVESEFLPVVTEHHRAGFVEQDRRGRTTGVERQFKGLGRRK